MVENVLNAVPRDDDGVWEGVGEFNPVREHFLGACSFDEVAVVAEEEDVLSGVLLVVVVPVDDGFVACVGGDFVGVALVSKASVVGLAEAAFAVGSFGLVPELVEFRAECFLERLRVFSFATPAQLVADACCECVAVDCGVVAGVQVEYVGDVPGE